MHAYQANVLVHLDESLQPDQFAALSGALGSLEGVTRVAPSARQHLVRVDYNPYVTGGQAILGQVRRQGLSAQLVGM